MRLGDRAAKKWWRTIPLPKANVKIGNTFFKIPRFLYNDFYKANYQTEDWLSEFLDRLHQYKPLVSAIDVGVNIGQTLLKLKSINPSMEYVGFEPNPYCCAISLQIINLNKLDDASIIPSGLSDKSQLLKLELSQKDIMDSTASLIEGFRSSKGKNFQYVSVTVLDDIWESLPIEKIDLIKIDVEGAELEAIIGMKGVIEKYNPIVVMEVLPSYEHSNEFRIKRQARLAEVISGMSYSIYQIKDKKKCISFKHISGFPIHKNINESDYILTPNHININDII